MSVMSLEEALKRTDVYDKYVEDMSEFAVDLVTKELDSRVRQNFERFFKYEADLEGFVEFQIEEAVMTAHDRDVSGYFDLFFETVEDLTGLELTLSSSEFLDTLESSEVLSDFYYSQITSHAINKVFMSYDLIERVRDTAIQIRDEISFNGAQ